MTTPEIERAARALCDVMAEQLARDGGGYDDDGGCTYPICNCRVKRERFVTAAIRAALSEPNDELSEALDDRFGPRQGDGSDILRFILNHLCGEPDGDR